MKFNSLVINFLCLSFIVACNTGPYLKTNAVDAFDLPLDASLNIEVDRDIPAKVDPIFVDFIKQAVKQNLSDRGNLISDEANLVISISLSSDEFIRDEGHYYRYPFYYRSPYDFDRIRSIDEFYLRISIFDVEADQTLWTGLTRWRPGSIFEPSNIDKAENLVGLILETI